MTRKVAALSLFVTMAMGGIAGVIGCAGQGGGPLGVQYAYQPNAGDCTTDLTLSSSNGVDPRTTVQFLGIPGTATAGVSETTDVSPEASANQVLFHAPCNLPSGTYNLNIIPPNGSPFIVGQFSKL